VPPQLVNNLFNVSLVELLEETTPCASYFFCVDPPLSVTFSSQILAAVVIAVSLISESS
jgi:hypothetical protein